MTKIIKNISNEADSLQTVSLQSDDVKDDGQIDSDTTEAIIKGMANETTVSWDGEQGSDSIRCDIADGDLRNAETGWIHWIFSTIGGSTDAILTLGGTGGGSWYEPGPPPEANTWHFYTPYYDLDGLTAHITYNGIAGPPGQLVISDFCPGNGNGNGNGEENWNPGDCYKKDFWIKNEGSKRANVRVKLTGAWYELQDSNWALWPDGDVNLVVITLHDESQIWVKGGDYWYFEDIAGSGEQWHARLVLKLCLDGENTNNDYQGKRFILTSYFESIQASNEASDDVWGWSAPEGKGVMPPK